MSKLQSYGLYLMFCAIWAENLHGAADIYVFISVIFLIIGGVIFNI